MMQVDGLDPFDLVLLLGLLLLFLVLAEISVLLLTALTASGVLLELTELVLSVVLLLSPQFAVAVGVEPFGEGCFDIMESPAFLLMLLLLLSLLYFTRVAVIGNLVFKVV